MEFALAGNNVANADAIDDPPILGNLRAALPHGGPHVYRKRDGIDNAGELHQRAVAHRLYGALVALAALGSISSFECRQRADLVFTYKATTANHVEGQYRRQTALYDRLPYRGD